MTTTHVLEKFINGEIKSSHVDKVCDVDSILKALPIFLEFSVERFVKIGNTPVKSVMHAAFSALMKTRHEEYLGHFLSMLEIRCAPVLSCQPEWLEICKAVHVVFRHGRGTSGEVYRVDWLYTVLNAYSEEMERDVVTQTAFILVLLTDKVHVDQLQKAIPRMAIERALVALGKAPPQHEIYMQFAQNGSGMEIHYAIQSLQLCVGAVLSADMISLALRHWDHPWQMVSSNCRLLYLKIIQASSMDDRTLLLRDCLLMEPGKRKFNCLFALIPHVPSFRPELAIFQEILVHVQTGGPSSAGACQLLQTILQHRPETIHTLAKSFSTLQSEIDWDQVFGAVAKASPLNCDLLIRACTDPIHRLRLLQHVGERLVVHADMLLLQTRDAHADMCLQTRDACADILSKNQFTKFILSRDSGIVCTALVVLLRSRVWPDLVLRFINDGGIAVVGCVNEDRSIIVREFEKHFKQIRAHANTQTRVHAGTLHVNTSAHVEPAPQVDTHAPPSVHTHGENVWKSLIKTAMMGTIQEECQLPLEVILAAWEPSEDLVPLCQKMLESKWAKLRSLGSKMAGLLPVGFTVCLPSILHDEIGVLYSTDVAEIDIELLAKAANATVCTEVQKHTEKFCLRVMAHYAQLIGEPSWLDLQALLGEPVKPGPYSVDCRGHPIVHASESEAMRIATRAWTCIKYASMCLQVSGEYGVRVLTILILSVKHPAALRPLYDCFARINDPLLVERAVLDPLIDTITDEKVSLFVLPVALRRSQGLGPLICACVEMGNAPRLLTRIVPRLLQNGSVHSVNVLRAIVTDSEIHERTIEPFLVEILQKSLEILSDFSCWKTRSAATQLFVQTARRVIGADNDPLDNIVASKRKKVSAKEFFDRGFKILKKIELILASVHCDDSVVVSVLAVLQTLIGLNEFSVIIGLIERQLDESNSMHVRRLCAKILARINHRVNVNLQGKWNYIHGRLLFVHYRVKRAGVCPVSIDSLFDILKNGRIPPIVENLLVEILVNLNVNLETIDQAVLGAYLSGIDQVDSRSLASVIVKYAQIAENSGDPTIRRLLAQVFEKFSNLVPTQLWQKCATQWSNAPMFHLGIAVLLQTDSPSQAAIFQMKETDQFDEEIRILLAKSKIFKTQFPDTHALLILDESPNVRFAASVDELNPIESFRKIVGKCSRTFLDGILTEKFDPMEEKDSDFCIRAQPRAIARTTHTSEASVYT